ncbi:MAG TPA: nucleotidyltransferase family protein [Bryobacteraceae bacterium]|nr:nucleotidyltransferase family protein [Bryobacteraceae bacterium]
MAYFQQARATEARTAEIKELFTLLNSAGLEAILHKGWAAARAYPREGLRPIGDIDLIIRPRQQAVFRDLLRTYGPQQPEVDFEHSEISDLDDRALEGLFARSQVVSIDEVPVRVLGAEDNLRLLSLHLMKHYAHRPLWLCDVAAFLESRPAQFDWEYCLGNDRRERNWITTALALAHRLLGADLQNTPIAAEIGTLPGFLVREVVRHWAGGYSNLYAKAMAPMHTYLRHPKGVLTDLANRWPGRLEAAIGLRKPIDETPLCGLPSQLAYSLLRTTRFLARLPHALRG